MVEKIWDSCTVQVFRGTNKIGKSQIHILVQGPAYYAFILHIMLCCSALKLHLYAQEQELLSDCYAFYMQFCMRNLLHVAENFIKTVLFKCINKSHQINTLCSITLWVFYQSISIIHYNFPQMLNIAINYYFILPYYAGIMLNALNDPLCS